MAYEPKPGSFSLFKNDRKEKDSHPDYKGDGLALDGTPVWVSAWLKEGKNGKFMSCSMQAKQAQESKPRQSKADNFDDSGDIPFNPIGRGISGHAI